MNPNDKHDPQLRDLLQDWTVPAPSANLEARVLRARQPWWHALWTSSIRIPVPVACGATLLLLAIGTWRVLGSSQPTVPCQIPSAAAHICQSDQPC